MGADDLRHAVHLADEQVAEAARRYLSVVDHQNPPSTVGLIVLNRTELLTYLGYLTVQPVQGDLDVARAIDEWISTHDLTEEFERSLDD